MAVCSSNSQVFIRVICHKTGPAQRLAVSDTPTVVAMEPRHIFRWGGLQRLGRCLFQAFFSKSLSEIRRTSNTC